MLKNATTPDKHIYKALTVNALPTANRRVSVKINHAHSFKETASINRVGKLSIIWNIFAKSLQIYSVVVVAVVERMNIILLERLERTKLIFFLINNNNNNNNKNNKNNKNENERIIKRSNVSDSKINETFILSCMKY